MVTERKHPTRADEVIGVIMRKLESKKPILGQAQRGRLKWLRKKNGQIQVDLELNV